MTEIICRYCGRHGLEWQSLNERWVLVDERDGSVHDCRTTSPIAVTSIDPDIIDIITKLRLSPKKDFIGMCGGLPSDEDETRQSGYNEGFLDGQKQFRRELLKRLKWMDSNRLEERY